MKIARSIMTGAGVIALSFLGLTASTSASTQFDPHLTKSGTTNMILMARSGSDNSGRGSDHDGGGDDHGGRGDNGGGDDHGDRGNDDGGHHGRGADDPAGDDHGGRGEARHGRGADDAPGDDHGVHQGVHDQNDDHGIHRGIHDQNDDRGLHQRRKVSDQRVMLTGDAGIGVC